MSLKMNESPYQRSPRTTFKIMMELCAALLVVWLAAIVYNFTLKSELGIRAILLMVVALVTTALVDVVVALLRHKKGANILDEVKRSVIYSYSYVTAIIFTLCCPVYVSYYVIIIGSIIATGLKHCFGGFGKNIFNPAIIGRIFTGVAFAGQFNIPADYADVLSSATVTSQYSGIGVKWLSNALPEGFNLGTLLLGNYVGAMGETFTLLILILGVILAIRGVINWKSTVFYLGTVAITALGIGLFTKGLNPFTYMMYHLCLGGLMFGAVFMITDPVTAPTSPFGKALVGVIAGLVTVLIRVDGNNPEGVMYSIAIINLLAPTIDKLVVGRTTDGHAKKWATVGSLLVASIAINTAITSLNVKLANKGNEGTTSSEVTSSSSSSSIILSREEQLFGYNATKVTLGTLPSETNIVSAYTLTDSKAPAAIAYELYDEYSWDTGHSEATIKATVGVVISLADDTIYSVSAIDAYGTGASFMETASTIFDKLKGVKISDVLAMSHKMSNDGSHNGCVHDAIDFEAGASKSKGLIFNLVVEAAKQYNDVDKLYNAFGTTENVAPYTIIGEEARIVEAYTFDKDGIKHVGYFVKSASGIEIDMHGMTEKIHPMVAIAINTTDDKISVAKVIGLPTTANYSSFASALEDMVAGYVGKTASEVSEQASGDVVANATYSAKGLFKYIKAACTQYIMNDKANLVDNGGAE